MIQRTYSLMLFVIFVIFVLSHIPWVKKIESEPVKVDIDAALDGPVYGDKEGLERVRYLEDKLAGLQIRSDHPRLYFNQDMLAGIRKGILDQDRDWKSILRKAESGSLIHAAFVFMILEDKDQKVADRSLSNAKIQWLSLKNKAKSFQDIAHIILAFDWIYSGLLDEERDMFIYSLTALEMGTKNDDLDTPSTLDWELLSMWKEVALAHHIPDAQKNFKSRWAYDLEFGDRIRMHAYFNDGTTLTPPYNSELDHILILNSAAGIEVMDNAPLKWGQKLAYRTLYRSLYRRVHPEFRSRILSEPLLEGRSPLKSIKDIAKKIFEAHSLINAGLSLTGYDYLLLSRLFPGGREAYFKTGWGLDSTQVYFLSPPALAMGFSDGGPVNSFSIYKRGALTGAHNKIYVIDPVQADSLNSGGIKEVQTDNFETFLHNAQANGSRILEYKTTKVYDYIISEASQTSTTRLNEHIRTLVFIRSLENAYIIVFDRIESNKAHAIKKWRLSLTGEPVFGAIIKADFRQLIPNYYEVYNDDFFVSSNLFKTAQLFCKVLLPKDTYIVKRGDKEVGTWQVEVIPQQKQKRDYFLNVLYAAEVWSDFVSKDVSMIDRRDEVIVNIDDGVLGRVTIRMPKTTQPTVKVEIENVKQ